MLFLLRFTLVGVPSAILAYVISGLVNVHPLILFVAFYFLIYHLFYALSFPITRRYVSIRNERRCVCGKSEFTYLPGLINNRYLVEQCACGKTYVQKGGREFYEYTPPDGYRLHMHRKRFAHWRLVPPGDSLASPNNP
jgi:hypothetical protein